MIGFYGSNQSHSTAMSRLAVSSGLNIAIDKAIIAFQIVQDNLHEKQI